MRFTALLALCAALLGAGCSERSAVPAAAPAAPASASPMKETPSEAPRAIIRTSAGDMTVEFWPDVAPRTVENFLKLSREGFYEGTCFHRIIKGFMIQGGCPNSKRGARGQPGTGGPGYQIKAEFNNRSHVRGVLSMARSSDPDSAGSQFFICHGPAPFLNNKYTAFGKLIDGADVLDKIAAVPCVGPEESTPTERVDILKVEIVGGGK
jgi:peptidyl-prolyl cis-trans isomerase B (cyclophilin B)